jgi:hypothetical protein
VVPSVRISALPMELIPAPGDAQGAGQCCGA